VDTEELDRTTRSEESKDRLSPPLHGLYDELCDVQTLRLAYTRAEQGLRETGAELPALLAPGEEILEEPLRRLSEELRVGIYHPTTPSQSTSRSENADWPDGLVPRDLVVWNAVKIVLENAFPPPQPCVPEPEKVIRWMAGVIEKGFCRIYAMRLTGFPAAGQEQRTLERLRQRVADTQLVPLVQELLASTPPAVRREGLIEPLLADVAFEGIDHILQNARSLAREGTVPHAHCLRLDQELVILSDQDARYDWIQPAVKKRLGEELAGFAYDAATAEIQSADLSRGERLRFLGFELRQVKVKRNRSSVQYRSLDTTETETEGSSHWRVATSKSAPRSGSSRFGWLESLWRKGQSIQVSWTHLPITLYPVLVLYFGWRSYAAWLCLILLFICNWRWLFAASAVAKSGSRWALRRWPDLLIGACGLAALGCVLYLGREVYRNRSREIAAPRSLPQGVYTGQYNRKPWWDLDEPSRVQYSLYIPPHLQGEKGPFPLVVFLDRKGGFPEALTQRIRQDRFDFIVFCPANSTGQWWPDSDEVEGAMQALDYVISRHRIDPNRIYLTGMFNGGDGVWRLAEAFPDRWAALVPVCATYRPEVSRVGQIPVWCFNPAPKIKSSPAPQENVVTLLKQAGTEAKYTALPNKGGSIGQQVYRSKEFYDWLANKKKG
jgi:Esterase PHB depolymerase